MNIPRMNKVFYSCYSSSSYTKILFIVSIIPTGNTKWQSYRYEVTTDITKLAKYRKIIQSKFVINSKEREF